MIYPHNSANNLKKILAFVAIAAASAALFAADNLLAADNSQFKLTTEVKEVAHVFALYNSDTKVDASNNTDTVDISKAGTYEKLNVHVESGNILKDKQYTVSVTDTDFKGATECNTSTVATTITVGAVADKNTVTVAGGKVTESTKLTGSEIVVSWTGNADLPADTYTDTITVTVATNY